MVFEEGAFRLTSYEWGVTYAGMLLATEATGEKYFVEYSNKHIRLISDLAENQKVKNIKDSPIHTVLDPHALDDAGALCAAFIKAKKLDLKANVDPVIKNFRLHDGTLARNRPQDNTLWLDDLFMAVPALVQMGSYTGEVKYFDDAVKQVKQFSERMFNKENNLYMHGWVVITLVQLLEVLPKNHHGYPMVLKQLQNHIKGLAKYQDGTSFWHQLIDRNDTYLKTSATAIYTYAIARAINRGYIDKMTYSHGSSNVSWCGSYYASEKQ